MELQFKKDLWAYLDTVLQEVQNTEQTLEMRLPEGLPDVGRILGAWGQPMLRSKEWRMGVVSLSGGMSLWVLYAPEDGTQPRCLDGWIPFQIRWQLPEDVPEGNVRIRLMPRFVDGRTVSARKIMVRAGIAAMAQALCPRETEIYSPESETEDVELLHHTYPVRLFREAGEKSFLLDEELELPPSAPEPEKLLYYRFQPTVTEQKVMGNKLVFKGFGNLHLLCLSEEGRMFSWKFDLPFQQFAELDQSHSPDSRGDVVLCVTSGEVELDEEGHFRVKCGFVAQYAVEDQTLLELTEDGYSPCREVTLHSRVLDLPAILETRTDSLSGEQNLPGVAGEIADIQCLPEFPRQYRTEKGIGLDLPTSVHVLYYGEDGALSSASARWEARMELPADGQSQVFAMPGLPEAQILPGSVKLEVPIQMTVTGNQGLSMVTGVELGERKQPDAHRPSLILKRAGEADLWRIAKESNSTVSEIRKANALDSDPIPGQMLLIPVRG